jgi:ADP-dependent NAD(P)H-hydrate dehydratase / NAD(P)H-hydrate epimerase
MKPIADFADVARLALATSAQAEDAERIASAQQGPGALMRMAGEKIARLCLARFPHAKRVVVVAGAGNNGGDGLYAALWLKRRGVEASVAMPREANTEDAKAAFTAASEGGVLVSRRAQLDVADVLIDALLGAGLQGAPREAEQALIDAMNAHGAPILAVDLPSGLQSNTGHIEGRAVHAVCTLALLALKPAHFTGMAAAHIGELWFSPLGVQMTQSAALLNTRGSIALPLRAPTLHKGAAGLGVATTDSLTDPAEAGLMMRPYVPEQKPPVESVIVFGNGAGTSTEARAWLTQLAAHHGPLVIDADGINLLATDPVLQRRIAARGAPTVLTPHPLEAARLANQNTAEIQRDRLAAAEHLSERLNACVVLKGAGSIISAPDQTSRINPSGNARLATAGSGDVLAGLIGSLIAQGLNTFDASCAAVYLHGTAAEAGANTNANQGLVLEASAQPQAIAVELAKLSAQRRS